jgi:rod shape-determining protein MreD
MRPANIFILGLTLIFALLLQLFPWSGQGIIFRPDFMLVIVIYWLLRAPNLCNLGVAWLMGILVDLATGSLLGQHAISFALTAFIGLMYQRRLVLFSIWQLSAYVFGLLVFARTVLLLLKLFAGAENLGLAFFWPCITGLILWLLIAALFGMPSRAKSKSRA